MPPVPEGIDLSWPVIMFLGALCTGVFLVSWKAFSVRNADHVRIAADLASAKSELAKTMSDKFDALISAIGRVESNAKEDISELHGRVNRNAEEIGEVTSKVEYQRGVTDTMKDFMLKDKTK